MNAVGIDVSKGKSMVAILRPFGEIVYSPFEIKLSNTVNMPVSGCKINPFLAAVTSGWAVKVSINARIGLIKDANEIILHSRLVFHVEAKLTVHGFKLIA